jgi:hypothetical protein
METSMEFLGVPGGTSKLTEMVLDSCFQRKGAAIGPFVVVVVGIPSDDVCTEF